MKKPNMPGNTDSVPEKAGNVKTFNQVKRDFETAYAADPSSDKTAAALLDLSTAIAYSVLNKCIDPQRKTAPDRSAISDNGHNPALLDLKRGIADDRRILDSTRDNAEKATKATFDKDGDPVTVIADKDAKKALDELIQKALSDGIDLVHTAVVAILEQAADHASGANWLDKPYTVSRLDKRVIIRREDSAAYKDVDTTPIQEAFRAVRKAVQNSRAIQTDPRNGYTYLEEVTADGIDTVYYRLSKYADLGGYNVDGNYTVDRENVDSYNATVTRLSLTSRQRKILMYRIRGYGYKAIGTCFGIDVSNVKRTMKQVKKVVENDPDLRKKAVEMGLIPREKN